MRGGGCSPFSTDCPTSEDCSVSVQCLTGVWGVVQASWRRWTCCPSKYVLACQPFPGASTGLPRASTSASQPRRSQGYFPPRALRRTGPLPLPVLTAWGQWLEPELVLLCASPRGLPTRDLEAPHPCDDRLATDELNWIIHYGWDGIEIAKGNFPSHISRSDESIYCAASVYLGMQIEFGDSKRRVLGIELLRGGCWEKWPEAWLQPPCCSLGPSSW